jgi:hypothetical protein
MRNKIALMTCLAALGALVPAAALAQDAAAPAAAPAEPTPVAAPATPPTPVADSAGVAANPEPAPTPASEAADAGPAPMPGWIRIDTDASLLQLWGGGTYPITDGVGLAFDLYANSLYLGELDVGPAITAGPLTLTPMIGLQIDWNSRKAQALVPQFYAVGSLGPIYTELWLQYYMNTVFNDDPPSTPTDPATPIANDLYLRLIADFKINDYIAAGLELDLNHNSENVNFEGEDDKIKSLAIGPNVMLSNVGAGSSFMAFIGYEVKDTYANGGVPALSEDGANHLTGRLTFVHNF